MNVYVYENISAIISEHTNFFFHILKLALKYYSLENNVPSKFWKTSPSKIYGTKATIYVWHPQVE